MSFSADVGKFQRKAMDNANNFRRRVAVGLFSAVVLDTPVDTGRARANWQLTLNSPASGEVDRSPSEAISEINTDRNYGKFSDSIFLTNNVKYILVLENGRAFDNGTVLAPHSMVKKNVARFNRFLADAGRHVRRGI